MYLKPILALAAAALLAVVGLEPTEVVANGAGASATAVAVPAGPVAAAEMPVEAVAGAEAIDDVAARVDLAVERLAPTVPISSHPEALRYAFRAYYGYRDTHPAQVRKPYLYFVDFGLDRETPRGYVFDMDALALVEGPFPVAHGRGSEVGGSPTPVRFLNVRGSKATSLGLYLAQETYSFSGKSGGRRYSSIGLRLKGVSGRFNDAARARGIVVHGAPYVTWSKAGRSEGCPAMPQALARTLIPKIANGGMVFHFSPLDRRWMREDPWAGAPPATVSVLGG